MNYANILCLLSPHIIDPSPSDGPCCAKHREERTQKMPAIGQWETSSPASARYCSHAYLTAAHMALDESCAWLDQLSPWDLWGCTCTNQAPLVFALQIKPRGGM